MKSYTIDELLQLYKNDKKDVEKTATRTSNDQVDALFKSLSSQQVDPKTLNEPKKEEIRSQLDVDLKESLKPLNPLEALYNDCVGPFREQNSSKDSNIISSKSRKIGKLLRDQQLFDQEMRKPTSLLYNVIVFDLLELNTEDSKRVLSNSLYSEKIDDYFRSKTGQSLFDRTDDDHNKFADILDSRNFPKYYEYGYHSKETEKSFDLKIDKNFLNAFKEIIHSNLKQHNFNLNSKEICESPNKYEIVDVSQHHQLMKKKKKTRAL